MGSKKNKRRSAQAGSVATEIRSVGQASGYSVDSSESQGKQSFWSTKYFEWLVLAVASVISYWILTARLVGVSVSVLIDEYLYVLDAHYTSLAEAAYPNQLFQLVYSTTRSCGPEFYSCARGINALFVIGSGLVLYFLAKHISRSKVFGAVAFAGGVFGSLGTYTAYFMPEAIFNFWILLFFYGLIRFSNSQNLAVWAGLGFVLGISSLAKPHAFFVVPALVIFIFLSARAMNSKYLGIAASRIAVFGTSLVATKFFLGYLIGGERALSIFGRYGSVEAATERATTTLVQNSGLDALTTSWGQTMMIVIILGVGLPVAILGLLSSFSRNREAFQANRARSLIAISLLNMMAVSALFEAWQGLSTWMHTRYYSYLIPLFLIVLIEAYINSEVRSGTKTKLGVVLAFLILGTVALVTAGIPYGANWIDAPDFRAHIDNYALSSIFIFVSLVLAIVWIWKTKQVVLVALSISLTSFLLSGTYISTFLQASFGQTTNYDHLGRVLRDYLPQEELERAVLIGDNSTNMERALFSALTGEAKMVLAPAGGYDLGELSDKVMWVVKVGNPELLNLGTSVVAGNGFSIHPVGGSLPPIPRSDLVLSASDPCSVQAERDWVCGDQTIVTYDGRGHREVEIDLVLEISEAAAKSDLEFVVGRTVLRAAVPEGVFALNLRFPGEEESGELIIRIATDSSLSIDLKQKFVRVVSVNSPRR